jgi:hypothetical protein
MTRRLLCLNNKSLHILILAIALLTVIFAAQQQQQAYAQKQGTFDNGYQVGTNDAKAGMERNNTCPPDYDHGQCFWYQQGYNLGYTDEKILHGSDRPRNDDNNGGNSQDDGENVDGD